MTFWKKGRQGPYGGDSISSYTVANLGFPDRGGDWVADCLMKAIKLTGMDAMVEMIWIGKEDFHCTLPSQTKPGYQMFVNPMRISSDCRDRIDSPPRTADSATSTGGLSALDHLVENMNDSQQQSASPRLPGNEDPICSPTDIHPPTWTGSMNEAARTLLRRVNDERAADSLHSNTGSRPANGRIQRSPLTSSPSEEHIHPPSMTSSEETAANALLDNNANLAIRENSPSQTNEEQDSPHRQSIPEAPLMTNSD
ncbi:hypothetical protein PROFUN_09574 [Planoprotostelium fungivorum]|uniref:Uncharacterized protein n=1 Tax=Planoprotostelium fungivorum TaxID=1890364 RepID=A0A2P6NGQ2_9EUKA|nr:hypothetical protein PROFUN_09574 [Planoprotostelium fungivorum]